MTNTEFIHLGEDLGMGANKLFGFAGGLQTVSQVASNGSGAISGMLGLKAKRQPMHIDGAFGSFYIGEGAHENGRPVENLEFDRLVGAPEMRALLYGSLVQYQRLYGAFDRPLSIMAGLPLQMMTGENAKANQQGVTAWLKGTHEFEADGKPQKIEIAKVRLTSQPVGALFDFALDETGAIRPGGADVMLDEVGIVSIGFNTLELLVVKEQSAVQRFTAGNTVGVRRLLELCNRENLYSLGELDERLRAGKLRAEIKAALPVWTREVNGEIEKRWGMNHRRFAKVLIVGGGALLLKDALTHQFGAKAWTAPDPVLSIASGLYKLSVMKR